MKLLIVDDNDKFRQALKFYIEEMLHHDVIGEAPSGELFLAMNPSIIRDADIVLMDIVMKELDGFITVKTATWYHPKIRVIAITMNMEISFLKSLIEAGFMGCVFKSDIIESLRYALDTVLQGNMYIAENLRKKTVLCE